jgi:hypothetical protein
VTGPPSTTWASRRLPPAARPLPVLLLPGLLLPGLLVLPASLVRRASLAVLVRRAVLAG